VSEEKRAIDERLASDKLESKRIASQRIQEFESRQFEGSRVREFELDSSVIPTVESEINKGSERLSGWVCKPYQVPPTRYSINSNKIVSELNIIWNMSAYSHSLKSKRCLWITNLLIRFETRSVPCKLKQEYFPKRRLCMLIIWEELIEYGKNLLISGSFKNHT
jgi:hypothetical protein